ncbi:hypothetical protein B296_00010640 [Ensete ventricosum]|uniref:50S ribosomal protein L21, chloroplastic n=1 Tax=Ensete ventricosum TaxID=4639 RepID=A0A426Z2W3_ENSVE|nr:hypothetical protein B296_00010640 [Ensete ventricosum]
MASTLGATALSSVAARFSLPRRTPIAVLSSKVRPLSLSSTEVSSSPAPLLPLRPLSACTRVTRTWKLCAASDGTLEPEEAPPVVPEPVEEQLAGSTAADAAKGEDVFAVVMVGSRQYIVFPGRFIYTQRLKGANVDDKVRGLGLY